METKKNAVLQRIRESVPDEINAAQTIHWYECKPSWDQLWGESLHQASSYRRQWYDKQIRTQTWHAEYLSPWYRAASDVHRWTRAVYTLSWWNITYSIIHVVFVSLHSHAPLFRTHPWSFLFPEVFPLVNVFTSLLLQVRESHKYFYNRAVDVPRPSTPTKTCFTSMHFHTLLRILTNNTQTYAHVQFPGHDPCDPRYAHAPPSLADKQKCTPLWPKLVHIPMSDMSSVNFTAWYLIR